MPIPGDGNTSGTTTLAKGCVVPEVFPCQFLATQTSSENYLENIPFYSSIMKFACAFYIFVPICASHLGVNALHHMGFPHVYESFYMVEI